MSESRGPPPGFSRDGASPMPIKPRRGGSNRAAIRRLRGYANRANGWFFGWLGVLIGGPVLSCGGINVFGTDTVGIFCGTSIRIRGERQFNDEYTLLGGDADEVAACFGEELVNLCVRERNLVLEARDGSLLVHWDGEEFPPRELADRLAVSLRVLRLLAPDEGGADAE